MLKSGIAKWNSNRPDQERDCLMKAMILAAGRGTRLQHLTRSKPKALIEIKGKTLLELLIIRLKTFGFNEIIINAHHFSEQIQSFLQAKNNFGMRIELSIENELLDTGGGLKKAGWFFDDNKPFLLHNVDVLTDLDYGELFARHESTKALATLAVRQRKSNRYLLTDGQHVLCGWENSESGEHRLVREPKGTLQRVSFMGIHIIAPPLIPLLNGRRIFPIIDAYLQLAAQHIIYLHSCDRFRWLDLGKPQHLAEAETLFTDYF